MIFEQRIIDRMERCYCVGSTRIGGQNMIYAASEAKNGGFYIYPAGGEEKREAVWEHGGGTMAVVPVPGEQDTLYAVKNFFPGFDAEKAEVVCCRRKNGKWEVTPVLSLPYLHRFDIFEVEKKRIFLGLTLCTSKKEKEDWSDPGKAYIGYIGNEAAAKLKVEVLAEGLVKNHGYWRGWYQGKPAGYIASGNGVFVFVPGKVPEECIWEKIWDRPSSEAALYDLDGCGEMELITIEPFHGNCLNIYKHTDGQYTKIYTYQNPMEFAHAFWVGMFLGKPTVICGARKMNKELFAITYEEGRLCTNILDIGNGSANVCIFESNGKQYILSANHARGEVAVYGENT